VRRQQEGWEDGRGGLDLREELVEERGRDEGRSEAGCRGGGCRRRMGGE
jgi:hypothetical protein